MNENYDLEEYDYENDDFEGYELQNINNLFICSFQDDEQDQLSTISVAVYRENLLKLMTFFKLSSSYNATMSVDIVAVDTINTEFRFSLIYILQSPNQNYQIQIITKTNNTLPILSSQEIYSAFNWAEREIWDLFGIFFIKHPDLRRILTDYGFSGHPLKKDFPISGFREVYYQDSIKQVVYAPLELTQGFRSVTLPSSWLNA